MNFDIFENLEHTNKPENVLHHSSSIELSLAEKLDAIQYFTVDRFEGNMAILENRKDGSMKSISKDLLPENAVEGSIITCTKENYYLADEETNEISKRISDKMNDLFK